MERGNPILSHGETIAQSADAEGVLLRAERALRGPVGWVLAGAGIAMLGALALTFPAFLPYALGGAVALALAYPALAVFAARRRERIALDRLREHAHALARTDALTGLPNRRAMLEAAQAMGGVHGELQLMLVDVDHFATINERHGSDAGDEILRVMGHLLGRRARGEIVAARMGGAEFALLGPTAKLSAAMGIAILAETRNTPMAHGEQATVSVGLARGPIGDEAGWRKLFARADEALYRAKREGRNRLVEAEQEDAIVLPQAGKASAAA